MVPPNALPRLLPTAASKPSGLYYTVAYYVFVGLLELLYFFFGTYRFFGYLYHRVQLRWLTVTYHQNRTPELIQQDVSNFKKIPSGIGAVLHLKNRNEEGGGVDGLLEQASDLSAWCLGADIDFLILYERSGVLKSIPVSEIQHRISRKLEKYYGANIPTFKINFPYTAASYSVNSTFVNGKETEPEAKIALNIHILSIEDGRQSIVDLSRSLAQLAAEKKISPRDITVNSLDHELKTLICKEPDLVYVFSPTLDLDGFPPWHIRLSEIFYMKDNDEVSYAVFLKGLEKYSGIKINVGR